MNKLIGFIFRDMVSKLVQEYIMSLANDPNHQVNAQAWMNDFQKWLYKETSK